MHSLKSMMCDMVFIFIIRTLSLFLNLFRGLSHKCESIGNTPKFTVQCSCFIPSTQQTGVSVSLCFAQVWSVLGVPCCSCNLSLYLDSFKYLCWVWAARIVQTIVSAVCSLGLCPPARTFLQLSCRYNQCILG